MAAVIRRDNNKWGYIDKAGSDKLGFIAIGGTTAPTPTPTPTPPTSQTVNPTPSTVYVNGAATQFEAYLIGGNNFMRLRDVMRLLDVGVGYDNATRNITIDTSQPYVDD